ncbi:MAG TPA: rhomboid family intramembrane serine protease, partial [Luteolibacter sp.]|nr:rhomboid family intramembrane serine protease [Luteolibacter sp.]
MAVPLSLVLCLVTAVVSLVAFNKRALMDALMFRPDLILGRREWRRLFSCALIHANAPHLIFNLIALHAFASCIEEAYSPWLMLAIYAASVLGASLLSLWLHHSHPYAALGASGGVCGVMFAAIFLVPGVDVGMLFLPIFIPGPVFAILYLVITFIALRRGKGNIGHDAHFGGAIT